MKQYGARNWTTICLADEGDYLSGTSALNLIDPRSGEVADWHQGGWTGESAERGTACHAATMQIEEGRAAWKESGLHDGRKALRQIGHPGADAEEPIPVAAHARAVTDLALDYLHSGIAPTQAVGADQVNRWIGTMRGWITLQVQASRIGRQLRGEERTAWHEWHRTLHPCRRWDTRHSAWWPLGYRP